ncbi:MAG TPA: heme-binding domain-containing protein [Bryobacteraceae bacterium]|nr:heme-binding domain-containing protein [Bryobacteraceae bacterium]
MLKKIALVIAAVFVLAQVVRPDRTNPEEQQARTLYAKANVPENVRGIFERSCRDCHSNRTTWPWYTNVAPVSWMLADHVKDGRKELNLSDWAQYDAKRADHKLEEICEQVEKGEMPMSVYVPLHPEAKLTEADKQVLCGWAKGEREKLRAAR